MHHCAIQKVVLLIKDVFFVVVCFFSVFLISVVIAFVCPLRRFTSQFKLSIQFYDFIWVKFRNVLKFVNFFILLTFLLLNAES